jgi:hypothetical protein
MSAKNKKKRRELTCGERGTRGTPSGAPHNCLFYYRTCFSCEKESRCFGSPSNVSTTQGYSFGAFHGQTPRSARSLL